MQQKRESRLQKEFYRNEDAKSNKRNQLKGQSNKRTNKTRYLGYKMGQSKAARLERSHKKNGKD